MPAKTDPGCMVNLMGPLVYGADTDRVIAAVKGYWHDGDYGLKVLAAFTMNIPGPGFVSLRFTGLARLSSLSRIMEIGIGTDPVSFRRSLRVECLEDQRKNEYVSGISFAVTALVPVSEGIITCYGLARGWPGYAHGNVSVKAGRITGMFMPKR